MTRVLPIPPPIPRKKAGVKKVPTRTVPRNTRTIVTINPTLKPYRTMAIKAMMLANPKRSQGKGDGMNISAVWMTTEMATRDEMIAFRLIFPTCLFPQYGISLLRVQSEPP